MSVRATTIAATFVLALVTTSAFSGPFRDAEVQLGQAYADYRMALFQTNQKDRAATDTALAAFRAKWAILSATWKATPPPQYAEDSKLTETLEVVTRIADEAQAASSQGELAKSHEILEAIRDRLGELRARNGVISFSDRMNAYHAAMEHALDVPEMTSAGALEQAAVLFHLAKEISVNRPAGVDGVAFDTALKGLEGSVTAFLNAARSGDKAAIDAARKGLKQPYSRMFLRFG
jgi:hypothetical protein